MTLLLPAGLVAAFMRPITAIARPVALPAGFLLLLALASPLLADTIYLKNGQVLVGRVTAQTQQMMQLDINGQLITLQKSQVARIVYDKAVDPAEAARRAEEARQAQLAQQKALEQQRQAIEDQARKQEELRKKDAADAARAETERQNARDQARRKAIGEPVRMPPVVAKSMILPGYGQISSGHQMRGVTYMALFFSSLAAYAYARQGAATAQAAYNQSVQNFWLARSTLPADQAALLYDDSGKRLYEQRIAQANGAMAAAALIYGAQLADAHFLSRNDRPLALSSTWRF